MTSYKKLRVPLFSISSSVAFLFYSFFSFFFLVLDAVGKAASLEVNRHGNVRQSRRRRRRSSLPLPLDGSPESAHFFETRSLPLPLSLSCYQATLYIKEINLRVIIKEDVHHVCFSAAGSTSSVSFSWSLSSFLMMETS